MRWGKHLTYAAVAGIIFVIVGEHFFGTSIYDVFSGFANNFGFGTGLSIALLLVVGIYCWMKSSRG